LSWHAGAFTISQLGRIAEQIAAWLFWIYVQSGVPSPEGHPVVEWEIPASETQGVANVSPIKNVKRIERNNI